MGLAIINLKISSIRGRWELFLFTLNLSSVLKLWKFFIFTIILIVVELIGLIRCFSLFYQDINLAL